MIQQLYKTPHFLGPEDADTACLLIHGFMGTPLEMRGLGEALAVQGIRVYNMVVAGHTGDPEDLLRAGHKEWIASAEEGLEQLAYYRYVFVAGLSMGGALTLILASRHPDRVAGAIVLSNLTRLTAEGWHRLVLPLIPLARHFIQWFYPAARVDLNDPDIRAEVLFQARLRDPEATIDFSDPQAIAFIRSIRIPTSAIHEITQLIKEERKGLSAVRVPLLIIHSKLDQGLKPVTAEELYHLTTAAAPKSLHWLEKSGHVITVGPEREEVFRLVISFIQEIVESRQTSSSNRR